MPSGCCRTRGGAHCGSGGRLTIRRPALAALEAKALRLRAERSRAAEDEAFAFDNDLSLIRSIEAMLAEARNTALV